MTISGKRKSVSPDSVDDASVCVTGVVTPLKVPSWYSLERSKQADRRACEGESSQRSVSICGGDVRAVSSLGSDICESALYDLRVPVVHRPELLWYRDVGTCSYVCGCCDALFWYEERLRSTFKDRRPHYHKCCENGRVHLPFSSVPPDLMNELICTASFMDNVRAYNQMFSMTSVGAHVDDSVNDGRSPYVFRISGQIYHWIGSLCPEEGSPPRFLQLYIYDTENEVSNRMAHFGGRDSSSLSATVVSALLAMLNKENDLVRLFRTAAEKCADSSVPEFKLRLFNVVGSRQYERPNSGTLGAVVFESGERTRGDYDLVIEERGGPAQRVNKLHSHYMALQFPLLFVYGEEGYNIKMTLRDIGDSVRRKRTRLSMNTYYSYYLHSRLHRFSLLLSMGRLFQQFVVTAYCSIELDRIDYVKNMQQDIRKEYLSGIHDAISRGDQSGSEVGMRTILPASFTGGPRYMYSHYLDALAICRVHGNPHFFITFTCNVKWLEITRELDPFPHLHASDRADIVARVFEIKVRQLIAVLKEEKPFGPVKAVLYTIEFQKRGLPHCHILLWVETNGARLSPDDVDKYISAELPEPNSDPCLFAIVSELMMHGPCGYGQPRAPCMRKSVCSKNFPKPYAEKTFFDDSGFAHYRRRKTGIFATRSGVNLDNAYVVPYNPKLSKIFDAHVNVEYCGWTMMIKYLFKYISKGTDRVFAKVTRPVGSIQNTDPSSKLAVDEIQSFIDARFICPHEACWRILNFPIHFREPAVQILAVHLENMQLLTFDATDELQSVVDNEVKKKTTLTEWFTHNLNMGTGIHLTYLQFPSEFVWYHAEKCWKQRQNLRKPSVGRLSYIHPAFGDVFYMRMLLGRRKGCNSFEDLRTIDGTTYPTFRSACQALGFLGDDNEWSNTLDEVTASAGPAQIRSLFVHILLYCGIADPPRLWRQHWRSMADDIPLRSAACLNIPGLYINANDLEKYTLYEIEVLLNQESKTVLDFGLPPIPNDLLHNLRNRLIMEELSFDRDALKQQETVLLQKMNSKQKQVYDLIVSASRAGRPECIFVYGHGGTGKTFLWKAIITTLRADGSVVLAVASSGIASLLLPAGRTAHSRFKIPLNLTDESMCNVKKGTKMAELLKLTHLIIWDEAPMNNRKCFETLDRSLRDILDKPDVAFGGKSVMLGGDFKQTLPVHRKGSKSEIIGASIVSSIIWKSFRVFMLTENMRLLQPNLSEAQKNDIDSFSRWLLCIGNGTVGSPDADDPHNASWVDIPSNICIPDDDEGLDKLISFIYDENSLKQPTALSLQEKAIICPKNEDADTINNRILQTICGDTVTYLSEDEATSHGGDTAETELLYPADYLNVLAFPGLPPHELCLKVGVPTMLLRNISLAGGLCNGTRMIITQLLKHVVEVEIVTGARVGEKVYIPRINLIHKDESLPFVLKRKQFPLKVSYAMTINKSQGQSLSKVGIYLPKPVFAHGQLYVALSRTTSPDGVRLLIKEQPDRLPYTTRNIVYKDFLLNIVETEVILCLLFSEFHPSTETTSEYKYSYP